MSRSQQLPPSAARRTMSFQCLPARWMVLISNIEHSIDNPEDAEEYAVEIVLSQIKGTINKKLISDRFAGPKAIAARIKEIERYFEIQEIHYEDEWNTYLA